MGLNQVADYFARLFSTEGFPPRWLCGFWTSFHGWFYIISDLGIWAAYFTIPLLLVIILRRRKDVPFVNVFWLFALFILACGTTHLMDALMFWWPAYRLSALIYFFTACVSWMTIVALAKVLPAALTLKTPAQLEQIVEQRTMELAEANRQISSINAQLKLYTRRLEQSNQALEQFATVASHDLQAPLRKIQIFGDYIKRSSNNLDATSLDYMERMQKTTGWMQQLIRDLLELSRITRKNGSFVSVNLKQIAANVLDNLQSVIASSGAMVTVDDMVIIDADEVQMQELLQNLVDNALKFHDGRPPRITLSAKYLDDDYCEIKVQDEGIGFKAEHKDRIFQMFERLHGEKYEGTGIGLAICKRIVERHGGVMTAQGEVGRGATFTIQLPIHQVNVKIESLYN